MSHHKIKYKPMVKLKLARLALGIDQKTLANMVGVFSTTICDYERGRTRPRKETLKKISICLKKPIEYFLEYW